MKLGINSRTICTGSIVKYNEVTYTVVDIKIGFYLNTPDVELVLDKGDGKTYEMNVERFSRALDENRAEIVSK